MFRGYMPALTLLVFGVGIGIGLAWTKGLIPLAVTPAKSGSLSPEFAMHEDLPPPPPPTPGVAESVTATGEQYEPSDDVPSLPAPPVNPSDTQLDANTIVMPPPVASIPPIEQPVAAAPLPTTSPKKVEQSNSDEELPPTRIRTRARNVVQLDAQSGIEDASIPDKSAKPVKTTRVSKTAHQDPEVAADDDRKPAGEADNKTLSPQEQMLAAEEKLASGETLAAHRDLSKIYWSHKEFRPQLTEILESTADAIFFQPKPLYVDPHVIKEGERLETIAKRYQLSWEYLATLNRTNPKRIQVDQKLKVMKGPFSAVVDIKDFALTIHLKGYFVKRYEIGIGKDGSSPTGKFTVLNKVENPQWTDDRTGKVIEGNNPKNPLGKRWIDLGNSYGIHGTIDPDSIGKAESRGCIRMRDKDIIEVYNFLVKGSEVVLRK